MLDRTVARNAAGAALNGVPRFDPEPLVALRAELAERVQARGGGFVVERWDARAPLAQPRAEPRPEPRAEPSAPPRPARDGRVWVVRDLVGLCIVSAALGAVALPGGLFGERTLPAPAPAWPTPAEPEPAAPVVLAGPLPPPPLATASAPRPVASELKPPAPEPGGAPAERPASAYAPDDTSPAFDCRAPLSFSEERVCANPILSERNAELGKAFRQAQAAGAPLSQLYREQDEWARMRNEAAYTAPGRLDGLYAARIAALTRQAQTPRSP